jgi:hypothetical protein
MALAQSMPQRLRVTAADLPQHGLLSGSVGS